MKLFFDPALMAALGVAVPLYWLLPARWRLGFLLALSALFLAWLHPLFVVVALVLGLGAHQLALSERSTRRVILTTLAVTLTTLAVGKYRGELAHALWGSGSHFERAVLMPLGISYFVLRLIHYVFDVRRGAIEDRSRLNLLTYLLFLPTYPAGPIETYQGFFSKRSETLVGAQLVEGLWRITLGMFKKIVLVDLLIAPVLGESALAGGAGSPLIAWSFVLVTFLRAYLDLSAYSDIAIGLSALFGFEIVENFQRPFWQPNPGKFWRSWHISLSSWCGRNVYFPVFGLTRNSTLALYSSMLVMGLWHDLTLNWLAWGLYHGTGLALYNRWATWQRKHPAVASALRQPVPHALACVATLLFVALGYSFVGTSSLKVAGSTIYTCLVAPFAQLIG